MAQCVPHSLCRSPLLGRYDPDVIWGHDPGKALRLPLNLVLFRLSETGTLVRGLTSSHLPPPLRPRTSPVPSVRRGLCRRVGECGRPEPKAVQRSSRKAEERVTFFSVRLRPRPAPDPPLGCLGSQGQVRAERSSPYFDLVSVTDGARGWTFPPTVLRDGMSDTQEGVGLGCRGKVLRKNTGIRPSFVSRGYWLVYEGNF